MMTAEKVVQNEILMCVSHLVATLAGGSGGVSVKDASDLAELCEQATEACLSLEDHESAASDEGWVEVPGDGVWSLTSTFRNTKTGETADAGEWEELCSDERIEPHYREIFEHWAVSTWLANKLEARGERIVRDFAGFIVWGRTTTGQAISMDSVIEAIVAQCNAQ